ncbi:MAG: hypothetical protein HUJ86_03660, partial [Synergistes sp.]|nr:hypothetical protein [Synergistes sp.]
STAADGSKKYTVSVTGGGSGGKIYKAGKNINFSGDDDEVINLNDNIALTKDGFVAIGDVSDNNRIVIGADTGEGTKMIVNRSVTDDGKENISFADSEKFSAQALEKGELKKSAIHTVSGLETADFTTPGEQKMSAVKADEFILLVSQDGKVTQGNDVSAQGMSAYDKTEEGKFVGATFNTQLMGISVSQDGKVSYGTGITAKGIEIEDNSDEKVKAFAEISSEAAAITRFEEGNNKQAYMDYDGYFAFSGPKEDTVEKIVGVTTGTTYNGQEYEAGLYVGDETTNELSYLTSDKLTVANRTYIDENGVNANDQKITNLAEGKISTDAARMDQLIELEEGSSVVIEKDGTDPETGKTKYKISAVGEGFLEGGDNINVTGDKINLDDNIQLTKDGSVTIGTEEDNTQI